MPVFDSKKPLSPAKINNSAFKNIPLLNDVDILASTKYIGAKYGLPTRWFSTEY
jgi:hypothetical protein